MRNNYITDLAEALSNNHAALMVGSGFSKNADKISMTNKEFLNWNELSDMFYTSIYGEMNNSGKEYCSSLRLAQEVEVLSGRAKLEEIIKDAVPDLDFAPSKLYVNLMQLPWVDVFTTNYDTLLERTLENVVNRRYNIVVCQEDLVNSSDAPRIIKLHGSFPSHRPFIITEEDNRTYPVKFAAFVNTVQQALLENVFCMLGFSCEDPNFLKWIGWIRDNLGKGNSQKIYLQLLRTYRELADWTQYDECRKKINPDILNYDDKQFLYACDWWSLLYRFGDKNLKTVLDEWKLSKIDLYWPLIKSSMYSIIGEYSSAE